MELLKNKVAVVTGGNSGIGKAIAIEYAKLGAKVLIVGRNKTTLEEVTQLSNNISYVAGDITDSETIKNIV